MTEAPTKAPWHVWLVGAIAVVFNSIGLFDFVVSMSRGAEYMAGGGFGTVDGLPIRALAAFNLPGTTAVPSGGERTQRVQMAASIPHPIRDAAVVRFTLPRQARVTLALPDAAGRRVRTVMDSALLDAGPHDIWIKRQGLAAGLYFLALRSDAGDAARKVVVLP